MFPRYKYSPAAVPKFRKVNKVDWKKFRRSTKNLHRSTKNFDRSTKNRREVPKAKSVRRLHCRSVWTNAVDSAAVFCRTTTLESGTPCRWCTVPYRSVTGHEMALGTRLGTVRHLGGHTPIEVPKTANKSSQGINTLCSQGINTHQPLFPSFAK